MSTLKLTDNDKITLRGLCLYPYYNDRKIGEAVGVKLSTVTAAKNKMKKRGYFSRYYIPAYHRLGYPLVSFSQIRMADIDFKRIQKNESGTVIPFTSQDPLNGLVIAHHRDYTAYSRYSKQFDTEWCHDLHSIDGAKNVVNFNFANFVNMAYFQKDTVSFKPITEHIKPYKFVNIINKKAFDGLLKGPEKNSVEVGEDIGVTRQSIVKIRELFRIERVLERTAVVDSEKIGIKIMSVIRFQCPDGSNKTILNINKILKPFYYWVFENVHMIMTGHKKYTDFVQDIEKIRKVKAVREMETQLFDVSKSGFIYNFSDFQVK